MGQTEWIKLIGAMATQAPLLQAQTASSAEIPATEQVTNLQHLPFYVMDNLPHCDFDATVNCLLNSVQTNFSLEEFVGKISQSNLDVKIDSQNLPAKVLIDARGIKPTEFHPLMQAYLAHKQHHPSHEAVLITGNHLTSQNSMLQTFQHT